MAGLKTETVSPCQIANHHLRGYGHVRWENDHAIVEDVCGGAANIDGRVYMQQAKKLAAQLKVMRATERELRLRQRPDHEATAIPFADVAC